MNTILAIGRLTTDPAVHTVGEQKTKLATFVLAVPKTKEEADFFRCAAWGKTAEIIESYCKKGSKIAISGGLHSRLYEDKEGKKQTSWEIILTNVDLLGTPKKGEDIKEDILPFDFPNGV